LPSKPQKFTVTYRRLERPTGQPDVQEYPTIRFHTESGTDETTACAPLPWAGGFAGKRTVGCGPVAATAASAVGALECFVVGLAFLAGFELGDGAGVVGGLVVGTVVDGVVALDDGADVASAGSPDPQPLASSMTAASPTRARPATAIT
jgi:hypothetical protein